MTDYMTPEEFRVSARFLRVFNAMPQEDKKPLGSPTLNLAADQLDWAADQIESRDVASAPREKHE